MYKRHTEQDDNPLINTRIATVKLKKYNAEDKRTSHCIPSPQQLIKGAATQISRIALKAE